MSGRREPVVMLGDLLVGGDMRPLQPGDVKQASRLVQEYAAWFARHGPPIVIQPLVPPHLPPRPPENG